jgi:hypothetical protein
MDKPTDAQKARFEELAEVVPEADRKLVFGGPCCLVAGNTFFGVHAAGHFVKLPPDQAEELLAEGGAPFEPMPGRPMNGFYLLPENEPQHWIRRSYEYATTLPPKKPKAKKP